MKIKFLTPYNKIIELDYHDILEFCKDIATSSLYRDDFNAFNQHYNYFSAYFDYIMFRLKYIMINPLDLSNLYAIADTNQIYFFNINDLDNYDKTLEKFKNKQNDGFHYIPRITKCDDLTLQIERQGLETLREVFIDPNMMSMMSKSTLKESHVLTSNTVLNQLLITSKDVCDDYQNYPHSEDDATAEYLVSKMGFIRLISLKYSPIMIINKRVSTLKERVFFIRMEDKYNYSLCNMDEDTSSLVPLYQKVLKQTKKELH